MSDIDDVMAVLNEWMVGLDGGDLERIVATCDPEVVICNQRQVTEHGLEAIRAKYGPIIEASHIKSEYDVEHIKVYGDYALLVGHFVNTVTDKKTGQKGGGEGRLVLSYRRHADGAWKMILDMDNNDERS